MRLHLGAQDAREDPTLPDGEMVMRALDGFFFSRGQSDHVDGMLRGSDGVRRQSIEDLLEAELPEVFDEPEKRIIPVPLRRLARPEKKAP